MKAVRYILELLRDQSRSFTERVFVFFSILSDIAVMIALVADIIAGEDIKEIILLIAVIIAVPVITFTCLFKRKIELAVRILIVGLVFVILPGLFFFGGGVEGGGVVWFIFAFLYIGLMLSGKSRNIMLALLAVLTFACYLIQYYHPEYVVVHSRSMFYVDSFFSLVLVGIVCFAMVQFQNRIFKEQNERAIKETERAEELNRSQNRFFSSMSHEIRTPINSILGLNELILREPDASDEIIKDAGGIQGAGKMLLSLINDILDFSKIEAGSMDIVPVDYHVGDMMSEIVNMIWLRARDKGLDFDVSIDPKVPSVLYGDEVRIKQILINLLNNAVKYTKEGSVGLHIDCSDVNLDKVTLQISVHDTGMGIKKEAIPFLFDAFKRVDEQKNRHIEGTGLGLSIVKQLIELMHGTIEVNSVYGEGSEFLVTLEQGVTDRSAVGELNIHNFGKAKAGSYESSFTAPEANVLIVDDNEMNLEVERKLLIGTEMKVDTVLSGEAALQKTLGTRYDVILMDHLMPEMDGIECLENIRNQTGGLDKDVPVVVLTANAGSENRELYNSRGFDGYLVKPVSGASLEETIIKYIPESKLNLRNKSERMDEGISTARGYSRKTSVMVTSSTLCDLPYVVVKKNHISLLPVTIKTDSGEFKDGLQMGSDELIRYMNAGGNAVSDPPTVQAYTEFFAKALKKTHHIIHIALTTGMSVDYNRAYEASKAFDNVTVINSEALSSASGLLVLMAYKLIQQNIPVPDIVSELETMKKRIRCSFIIDTTEYMARKGLVSGRVHGLAKALDLHPCLTLKDDKSGIGGVWMGDSRRAYRKYIRKAIPVDIIPDPDVLFITYVDIPEKTLQWIKEEVSKVAYFENVVFKQASAAISSNCGPGTFGLLYFVKGNKSYGLSTLFPNMAETELKEKTVDEPHVDIAGGNPADRDDQTAPVHSETEQKELLWYEKIEGIDGKQAITNSGSEDAFKTVLKIFYDSIPVKSREISGFYEAENWPDYTIKVHALKSSARLIGAEGLAEKAQQLETAGKEEDLSFIRENHDSFMEDYLRYAQLLKEACGDGDTSQEASSGKKKADPELLKGIYEAIKEAAGEMDCDVLDEKLQELSEYDLPESDKERVKAIREKYDMFDFDGIAEALE